MKSIISLQNVTFTYAIGAAPALRDLTLEVQPGQICGVVGRAGAGKSTLCALCAGFMPQFYHGQVSGSAMVNSMDLFERPVAELVREVGLVSSNPFSQISGARFSVSEEIGFGLENLGLPRAEIRERIAWALSALRLEALRDRSPYELSGGQQQRVALASALAMRPPVLVLDEPTAQLDPFAAAELAGILRELSRQGTTILFAEHRLEWAAELAERIVALDEGHLIADGPPDLVLADPLLLTRKIGWPRPALLAAHAREQGLWPADRPFPVTLDGLVAGIQGSGGGSPGSRLQAPGSRLQAPGSRLQAPGSRLDSLRSLRPLRFGSPVELDDVSFTYPSGVVALRGVSLRVGAGERVALLGRNGAGKSTLVRHLNGLLRPSSGRAMVAGVDTRATTVARCARQVGIVFQDIRNQLFARTVRDELRFGPRNLGYAPARIEAQVENALQALGLATVADEHPYDLPPPHRRLVAIAAVLAMDTPLLVLDEPTAGLDTSSVELLIALIHDLAARGKSVVVVSHDLDFCFEALERVLLLREGQLILDTLWSALADTDLAALEAEVGLPIALRAVRALGLNASPPSPAAAGEACPERSRRGAGG